MVKVEFFEDSNLVVLKKEVNDYLKAKNLRADNIIKIEYNTVLTSHEYIGNSEYNFFSYSVMIVIDNWREMGDLRSTVPEPQEEERNGYAVSKPA